MCADECDRNDRAWTEFTYDGPDAPRLMNKIVFDGVRLDREEGGWRQYRQIDDAHNTPQASLSLMTCAELARFLQIVQDTNFLFYDQRAQPITARDILTQYKRYRKWREELPQPIFNLDMNAAPLPHVFFLQQVHSLPSSLPTGIPVMSLSGGNLSVVVNSV